MSKNKTIAGVTAAVAAIAITVASCAWWKKNVQPVVDDTWDCIKQEADAASQGKNWIELGLAVTIDFVTAMSSGVDPATAVLALVEKYGAPVVACTLNELRGGTPTQPATPDAGVPDAGAGSGSFAPQAKPMRPRKLMALPDPVQRAATMAIDSQHWRYR